MEMQVEIRYAGVVVALVPEITNADGDGRGLLVCLPDPLPVGTVVGLGNDNVRARVEKVVEAADPQASAMVVRLLGANEEAGWPPPEPTPMRPVLDSASRASETEAAAPAMVEGAPGAPGADSPSTPLDGDLPPARPIQADSRRRTGRRRKR